jgi:1A family penicillin-binding protein
MKEKKIIKKIIKILIKIGRPILRFLIWCGSWVYIRKKIKKKERKNKIKKNKKFKKIIFSSWRYKIKKRKILLFLLILGIIISIGIYLIREILIDLPNVNEIYNPPRLSTKIFDRNGVLLYKFYEGENRTWVAIDKIPKTLIDATIAVEDKDFMTHKGISIKGILRAGFYNLINNQKIQGGSTITQQLVKNVFLSSERTWERKIKEMILAIMVEKKLSKMQILERYFNQVPYGGEIYGIQEASWKFFDKNVWQLTDAQGSYLAGLPAAPSSFLPTKNNGDYAKIRHNHVINEMLRGGFIDQDKAFEMREEDLEVINNKIDILAPHFVFYIKKYIMEKFGLSNFERQGLKIKTTLDINQQKMAENIVKDEVDKVKKLNISNGAALAIDVKNGDILAMVGSVNGDYNVTTALRQPGSAIKPINYLLALQKGRSVSSIIDDAPTSYYIPGQDAYTPQNYGNKYFGPVTLKTALASSLNVPSVKLLNQNGVENMIDLAESMGINTWKDRKRFGLALALGSGEVKMIELAEAYEIFANLGEKVKLNPILEIENYLGEIIYEKQIEKEKVVEPKYAYLINSILSSNEARAPVFGLNSQLNIKGSTVAVKTGTTNNLRDNWCIGWTPSLLVSVWVGNNNNEPMSQVASGVSGATPIWNKIMKNLIKNKNETWEIPKEVYKTKVCGKEDYYVDGTEKNIICQPTKTEESE